MTTATPSRSRLPALLIASAHLGLLAFCVRTNTLHGVSLEEGRYIPAGVAHWRGVGFAPAADAPPMARMVAALPLLPLGVNAGCDEPGGCDDPDPDGAAVGAGDGADPRVREWVEGGRFASAARNVRWYRLFCLARMTGFLWWAVGGWVILRWSAGLHGRAAGRLSLALWAVLPGVLGAEQVATPALPAAVAVVSATYVFGGYLRAPSWRRACAAGLWLGVAQLVAFGALALLVVWPLLALVRRLTAGPGPGPGARRPLRVAAMAALALWVVNLGYGFEGTGSPLGGLAFTSRALAGASGGAGGRGAGNRFRGTRAGRAPVPLPSDYLKGLDRNLRRREAPPGPADDGPWPAVPVTERSLASAAGRPPVALGAMVLGALAASARRRPVGSARAVGGPGWVPVVALLGLTAVAAGPFPPADGVLLATPFGVVIAGRLAAGWGGGAWRGGWWAAALSAGALGDGLVTVARYQFDAEHRVLFRRDLEHLREKLGVGRRAPGRGAGASSGPGAGAGVGVGGRGLLYRSLVDSRGAVVHYALFVPRGYRGDRAYPLILFLHGLGDRGAGGRRFTSVGLPVAVEYRGVDALVLCPQGRSGTWEAGGDDARRALEVLDAVRRGYRVDPRRVYLTGLSSGGDGVWALAAADPGRWAALVPVACSGLDPGAAPRVKHLPCWCFHNRYDGAHPVGGARRAVAGLRAAGGRPRYTEFLDLNHSAWEWAYDSPALYDWLLRQRRP
jgi:predicted esterase